MAKLTRMVKVEEEGTFAVLANDAVIADGCETEYEASAIALLLSGQPMHIGKMVTIAFVSNDGDGDPEDVWEADRHWFRGAEYMRSDDQNLYDALSWTARAAMERADRESGRRPRDYWSPGTPEIERQVMNWVLDVAAKHDLTERLPDQFNEETTVDLGSADRYHVGLLLDIVRGNPHTLDPSERKAMAELVARLAENAGIFPDE